jgi:glutamine amidotransferase
MITIVDYGMGNLRSVQKGFEKLGHSALITSDKAAVRQADRLVLPGVGASADAMRELIARDLVEPLREFAGSGKPFLGICLGLQLLFEVGHEGGRHEGLGILPGEVVRFAPRPEYKVPHMGWNQVDLRRPAALLEGIPDGAYMYFVHSYYAVPSDTALVAAETCYPDPFAAVVGRDNVFATQFHPEKSQSHGLRLLKNFAELN